MVKRLAGMNPLSQDPSRNLVIMKALTPVRPKTIVNDPDLRTTMPLAGSTDHAGMPGRSLQVPKLQFER
jgi:hypothetical protein